MAARRGPTELGPLESHAPGSSRARAVEPVQTRAGGRGHLALPPRPLGRAVRWRGRDVRRRRGPGSLDRDRCCPVLAIWLFAAHAHTALSVPSALAREEGLVPLPLPKATCDSIRLHQIGSLRCPAAFSVGAGAAAKNATPTAAVNDLEKSCRNASYAASFRCVQSLQKGAAYFFPQIDS
ncbi:uncharacterized GPI-anchored protein At4g28100-like [Miscanthus floridulus]|uniref:uncharacterized GPI-anchored protein At4g28100-like n=1 Tax=Miscanthus floridulus TaxID=154761 RepID=UPI0034587391